MSPAVVAAVVDEIEASTTAAVDAGHVPADVGALVARICGSVRVLDPRLEGLGAGSRDVHTIVSAATRYLPAALATYRRLPAEYAAGVVGPDGRTAHRVLTDQLEALAAGLAAIEAGLCARDAAALVAHGAFLADKFTADPFTDVLADPFAAAGVPWLDESAPAPGRSRRVPRPVVLGAVVAAVAVAVGGVTLAGRGDPGGVPVVYRCPLGDPRDTASPTPTGPSPTGWDPTAVEAADRPGQTWQVTRQTSDPASSDSTSSVVTSTAGGLLDRVWGRG